MTQVELAIEKLLSYYQVFNISDLANKMKITQATISNWKNRNSINAVRKKCRELKIYENIFEKQNEKINQETNDGDQAIYNVIEELKINMSHEEIVYELKKISLKKLIERLTEFPIFSRIILILDPERPSLFLYYIAQLIRAKINKIEKKNIINYKDFFIESILELPILSLVNQPMFVNKNKKDIVENISIKFSEENCKEIIENCKDVIELLEQKMPLLVIKAHRK